MHQLGELEDRSLSDIVHYKGCLVCVLKKVDISSTDPRDQLMDLSSCPTFDLSVGYPQIKSEPTMFVMLSYSWFFLKHTPLYSLVWPMLSPCPLNYGISFKRKPGWIVVEPIDNILISSMILLDNKLVLETFESIFFMLAHEVFVWWKEWLPLIHVHWWKLPPWIWES